METVDGFYNKKYAEASRRSKLLYDRYGSEDHFRQTASTEEVDDTIGMLLELRSQLRKLQWYGEVNRRGFVKILKKKDKKIPTSKAQRQYLQTRVDPRPFASSAQLNEDLNTVNAWLSKLGELKQNGDETDTESTGSLSRTATTNTSNLSKELLDEIERAAKADDVEALVRALDGSQDDSQGCLVDEGTFSKKFLLHVLQRAISNFSERCIVALLSRLTDLEEDDDINKRNCIHRLVISLARAKTHKPDERHSLYAHQEVNDSIIPAEAPSLHTPAFALRNLQNDHPIVRTDVSARLLQFLLENLGPAQRSSLTSRDTLGRLPLHHAAQFGFTVICDIIVNQMRDWNQFDVSQGLDSGTWCDGEGNSPLHLSVLGGHLDATNHFLDACRLSQNRLDPSQTPARLINKSNALLTMAVKENRWKIAGSLIEAGADVNEQDGEGETPLHTAARFGHLESVRTMIAESQWQRADLDIPEKTFGWTPILVASVDGHPSVVQLLADAGALIDQRDSSGWTAKEHAALRGHLDIAQLLVDRTAACQPYIPALHATHMSRGKSLNDRSSANLNRDYSPPESVEAIKSFGHRYLKDESLILVSLGSMDQRKDFKPVALDNIPLAEAHATQLDTALSVLVTATGANFSEPTTIDLPVNENISTAPIVFTAKDVTKVKLLFDIVPTYSGSKASVVGRGVALLSSVKPNIGSRRMNLQGDISVPIIASKTMDCIGTVNFNFLAITPFAHPNMSISANQTYWKSMTGPMVIGHRGMGKNMSSRKSLQLGENTLQSFIAAANLGASYVEFDVQLTKDHVPVIYHDFLVSETGIDAPVHTLTLEQFLHVNETASRTPSSSRTSSPKPSKDGRNSNPSADTRKNESLPRGSRSRSLSEGATSTYPNIDMSERMKHTRDFKLKGFKGNSRGNFIQAPFTTLEEMLKRLPQHIGFNIEMKYPMLFESEEQEMDTYAVELNSFVDTVLNMVYDHGKQRNIIFSSFNPDICLLLSFKQPSIPILFLTDAGTSPVGDIRASSLQEAIRFASRWNLLGVVSAAEPLVACPRLVRVVKESGLVCVSYGTLNNDPKNVQKQVDEGIDAVIVDSVLAIRKGLTGGTSDALGNLEVESEPAKKVESMVVVDGISIQS